MHDIARNQLCQGSAHRTNGFSQRGRGLDSLLSTSAAAPPSLPPSRPPALSGSDAAGGRDNRGAALVQPDREQGLRHSTAAPEDRRLAQRPARHRGRLGQGRGRQIHRSRCEGGGTLGACMSARTLGSEPLTPSRPCDRCRRVLERLAPRTVRLLGMHRARCCPLLPSAAPTHPEPLRPGGSANSSCCEPQ